MGQHCGADVRATAVQSLLGRARGVEWTGAERGRRFDGIVRVMVGEKLDKQREVTSLVGSEVQSRVRAAEGDELQQEVGQGGGLRGVQQAGVRVDVHDPRRQVWGRRVGGMLKEGGEPPLCPSMCRQQEDVM